MCMCLLCEDIIMLGQTRPQARAPYLLISILVLSLTLYYILHQQPLQIQMDFTKWQDDQWQQLGKLKKGPDYGTMETQRSAEDKIRALCTRPNRKSTGTDGPRRDSKFKPTPQAYFAYCLHEQLTDPDLLAAELQHYQSRYSVSKHNGSQLPLCIVSTGRNIVYQNRYRNYLDSLARQQYGNYRVVLVDDASDDGSMAAVRHYLHDQHHTALRDRIQIIEMRERMYALYNRDKAIRQHCGTGDIVIQLDSDDQFIGTQVLSTINAIYSSNPQIWVMYSSYIYWSPTHGQPTQGISAPVSPKILQSGSYRETTQWYTSATRTFLRSLYLKIDTKDFLVPNKPNQYHKWTSDLFVHYSLVEMAGLDHYRYVHEVFYYYYQNHNGYNRAEKMLSRLDALLVTPYAKLGKLEDEALRDSRARDLQWIYDKKKEIYECSLRHGQNGCDHLFF